MAALLWNTQQGEIVKGHLVSRESRSRERHLINVYKKFYVSHSFSFARAAAGQLLRKDCFAREEDDGKIKNFPQFERSSIYAPFSNYLICKDKKLWF